MQVVRIVLATVVTIVWLVGYGLAYYNGGSQPTGLNVLMAIVLGWVFGGATWDAIKRIRIEKRESGDERESDDG